jgi:hypothetical protein
MWANRVWCHEKDVEGKLTTVGFTEAPGGKDHPRWVEMHPKGKYLYALMEAGNRVCEYTIDEVSHLPVYTDRCFPLIPPGTSSYSPFCLSLFRAHSENNMLTVVSVPRYTQPTHVPLRRRLPDPKRTIPLRDLAIKLDVSHGLHRGFQDW